MDKQSKAKTSEEIETIGKQLANCFTPFMDSRLSQTDVDKVNLNMGKAIDNVLRNLEAQNKEFRELLYRSYHAIDVIGHTGLVDDIEQALKEDKNNEMTTESSSAINHPNH